MSKLSGTGPRRLAQTGQGQQLARERTEFFEKKDGEEVARFIQLPQGSACCQLSVLERTHFPGVYVIWTICKSLVRAPSIIN